uniref:Uncharacterized protein n=1 Tax=Arundo donax TaxID=35708 RepID=A0A0A9A4M9_ARUDO
MANPASELVCADLRCAKCIYFALIVDGSFFHLFLFSYCAPLPCNFSSITS